MRMGVIQITPELLAQLLHLPEGCTIVSGWTPPGFAQNIALLVIGDGLPEECEHEEGVGPRQVTPRFGATRHDCGHDTVACVGIDVHGCCVLDTKTPGREISIATTTDHRRGD